MNDWYLELKLEGDKKEDEEEEIEMVRFWVIDILVWIAKEYSERARR